MRSSQLRFPAHPYGCAADPRPHTVGTRVSSEKEGRVHDGVRRPSDAKAPEIWSGCLADGQANRRSERSRGNAAEFLSGKKFHVTVEEHNGSMQDERHVFFPTPSEKQKKWLQDFVETITMAVVQQVRSSKHGRHSAAPGNSAVFDQKTRCTQRDVVQHSQKRLEENSCKNKLNTQKQRECKQETMPKVKESTEKQTWAQIARQTQQNQKAKYEIIRIIARTGEKILIHKDPGSPPSRKDQKWANTTTEASTKAVGQQMHANKRGGHSAALGKSAVLDQKTRPEQRKVVQHKQKLLKENSCKNKLNTQKQGEYKQETMPNVKEMTKKQKWAHMTQQTQQNQKAKHEIKGITARIDEKILRHKTSGSPPSRKDQKWANTTTEASTKAVGQQVHGNKRGGHSAALGKSAVLDQKTRPEQRKVVQHKQKLLKENSCKNKLNTQKQGEYKQETMPNVKEMTKKQKWAHMAQQTQQNQKIEQEIKGITERTDEKTITRKVFGSLPALTDQQRLSTIIEATVKAVLQQLHRKQQATQNGRADTKQPVAKRQAPRSGKQAQVQQKPLRQQSHNKQGMPKPQQQQQIRKQQKHDMELPPKTKETTKTLTRAEIAQQPHRTKGTPKKPPDKGSSTTHTKKSSPAAYEGPMGAHPSNWRENEIMAAN
ncbi:unnamed protein product [Trypanosoma congolense IL3000]|uniref:WGS project CAEQ00000000 data, annotated contig 1302 n=1 Tax=Trypanosoma congolense (strain IL3000) TaxID=1068625 RepID=F9W5A8_TRYCI|nr:unnamed protein product [Trypanosoma congolense IL3000]